MNLSGNAWCLAVVVSLSLVPAMQACSSDGSTSSDEPASGRSSGSRSSSGSGAASGDSSGSGASGSASGSGSESSGSATDAAGDDASAGSIDASSGAPARDGGSSPDTGAPPPPACTKGQVKASQVVMLGDSYLDKSFGNVGANIVADAQKAGALPAGTAYREYYLAGAAVNNGGGNLNIPYQYDVSAKGDLTVASPKDIQIVIMDGGGNDVLIDQQSCLTDATAAAQMADMGCMNAVAGAVGRMKSLWQEMASDGVKQIVYFFYPHLDPAGGGLLPAPSPGVNLIDDYAAPQYQKICCGSSFTPTATAYTCSGDAPGTRCTYVDTRPAFTGHSGALGEPGPDWILSDHVHPNAMGSTAIADLVWSAMVANCIAQ
jgi:hypothetical protein